MPATHTATFFDAGSGINVAGTQVLSTQQSVVARIGTDSASDFANAAANTLNSILDAIEAHGLTASS